jgi:hypothetical protein
MQSHNIISPLVLSLPLSAAILGCADDEVPGEIDPPCLVAGQCKNDHSDEVGDGDGDKPEAELYCAVHVGNGVRTVYQCSGQLTASLEFQTLLGDCAETLGDAEWCRESHHFGVGEDPYEAPAVMACCDASGTPDEELLRYCAMDLIEQACLSVPLRLEALIQQGAVKQVEAQAKNLLWWLNEHQQECYDALHQPSDLPGTLEIAKWHVNGGDNENWPLLKDFTVSLEKADVQSASLPQDEADQLLCEDTTLNNTDYFEESGPVTPALDLDMYHLGESLSVPILGPHLPDGTRVHGSATAISESLCAEPRCSTLVLGEDDGRLVIQDLSLFAEGIASVSMGEMFLEVDRLTLRLYGVSQAQPYGNASDEYFIEAGGAHFLVTGAIGDWRGTRWATNATPLRIRASDGGWILEAFTLVHTDGLGGTWHVAIPQTTWD